MFNPQSKEDQKKAYDYIYTRCQDYWLSSLYSQCKTRYEKRRNAFYCRPETNAPKWRSKLYFATYFLSVTTLESQLQKSYSGTPFVDVGLMAGSARSPEVNEKLKLLNFDLNRDLYTGRFLTKLERMRRYMILAGFAVAREYFATEVEVKQKREVIQNAMGMNEVAEGEEVTRTQQTVTDVIHPLNFAMDGRTHEIRDSRWSCVRFPMDAVNFYGMLGNEDYNQEDVKKCIEEIEKGALNGSDQAYTSTEYYLDEYWSTNNRTGNNIIAYEYSGDLNYQGNAKDNMLYYAMLVPKFNAIIRCNKSPFRYKNHWKIAAYPDPSNPTGVGPCDMVLPIGYFRNDTMNQYLDNLRATARVMYEMYPGNIVGGIDAIMNGQSFGFALAATEAAYQNPNGLIRPVRKDQMGVPNFWETMNYFDKYETQMSPSSNLRGMAQSEQLNKTATGIGFQATREDSFVQSIRNGIDRGLEDCMFQKVENRLAFTDQFTPLVADIDKQPVEYFPFELGGPDYQYQINNQPSDVKLGRIQQALQIAAQQIQTGVIDPQAYSMLLRKMFELSGVPGAAELVRDTSVPPQIPGGGPEQPGIPGAMPEGPEQVVTPQDQMQEYIRTAQQNAGTGAANAVAAA